MVENPEKFADLLRKAVNQIHALEGKPKLTVRDELGYAVGRYGRTAIDYWCRGKGHIPEATTVELLAREIFRRNGFTKNELEHFLRSACYPDVEHLCNELFPEPVLNTPPHDLPRVKEELVNSATSSAASKSSQIKLDNTRGCAKWFALCGGLIAVIFVVLAAKMALQKLAKPSYPSGVIELVDTNNRRILVETNDRTIVSGDSIQTYETITVTFKILNNGSYPATIRSLVTGARGPGVSCSDKNAIKWSAWDNPFPPIVNITLQPGQEYEYRGSRAFYKPGNYFLEPVYKGSNGHWNGIPPFTCMDIAVFEAVP